MTFRTKYYFVWPRVAWPSQSGNFPSIAWNALSWLRRVVCIIIPILPSSLLAYAYAKILFHTFTQHQCHVNQAESLEMAQNLWISTRLAIWKLAPRNERMVNVTIMQMTLLMNLMDCMVKMRMRTKIEKRVSDYYLWTRLKFRQVDPTRDSSSHSNHCGTSQSPSPASATRKRIKMLESERKARRAIAERQRRQRKKVEG